MHDLSKEGLANSSRLAISVLLSKDDKRTDSQGNEITFYEGMPVSIYQDDAAENGDPDCLIAEGSAIKKDLSNYPNWQHVKWCCLIDLGSLMHESDLSRL